jgi:hypothetical protein
LIASMRLLHRPGKAAIWQGRYCARTMPGGLCAAPVAGSKSGGSPSATIRALQQGPGSSDGDLPASAGIELPPVRSPRRHRSKPKTKPGKPPSSASTVSRRSRATGGRDMKISHQPMILCFIFTVLGSTLAVAGPMGQFDGGCRSHGKKAAACHVPISEPGAAAGRMCCRLPNAPKDDWPAGMILGNADLALPLPRRLNA